MWVPGDLQGVSDPGPLVSNIRGACDGSPDVTSSTKNQRNLSTTPGAERGRLKPTDGTGLHRRCAFLLSASVAAPGLCWEQLGSGGGDYGCFPLQDCRPRGPARARTQGQLLWAPSSPLGGIPRAAMASIEDSSVGAGTFPSGCPAGVGTAARRSASEVRRADAGGRSTGAARGARRVRRRGLARGRAGRRSEGKLIADLSSGCGSNQDTMQDPGTRPTAAGR